MVDIDGAKLHVRTGGPSEMTATPVVPVHGVIVSSRYLTHYSGVLAVAPIFADSSAARPERDVLATSTRAPGYLPAGEA